MLLFQALFGSDPEYSELQERRAEHEYLSLSGTNSELIFKFYITCSAFWCKEIRLQPNSHNSTINMYLNDKETHNLISMVSCNIRSTLGHVHTSPLLHVRPKIRTWYGLVERGRNVVRKNDVLKDVKVLVKF